MAITTEQDKARPTGTLGVERWVQFAYAACAITLAWFLIKVTEATWTLLADTVDAVPEPNRRSFRTARAGTGPAPTAT